MCLKKILWAFGSFEKPSPQDFIPDAAIKTDGYKIIIDTQYLEMPLVDTFEVRASGVSDSGSMDPVMDEGSVDLEIFPITERDHLIMCDNLKVGDIAVYSKPGMNVRHRIVKIGEDWQGRYFKFQGDNNPSEDNVRVRDEDIICFSIGVIN